MQRKRYRYTGKEKDEETGLYYHGARYYAPWLGMWTAADPAGMVDGACLYAYVRNHPTGLVDPDGRAGVSDRMHDPFGAPGGISTLEPGRVTTHQAHRQAHHSHNRSAQQKTPTDDGNTAIPFTKAGQEAVEYYAVMVVDGEKKGGSSPELVGNVVLG